MALRRFLDSSMYLWDVLGVYLKYLSFMIWWICKVLRDQEFSQGMGRKRYDIPQFETGVMRGYEEDVKLNLKDDVYTVPKRDIGTSS
jgi:hypothetical protein